MFWERNNMLQLYQWNFKVIRQFLSQNIIVFIGIRAFLYIYLIYACKCVLREFFGPSKWYSGERGRVFQGFCTANEI